MADKVKVVTQGLLSSVYFHEFLSAKFVASERVGSERDAMEEISFQSVNHTDSKEPTGKPAAIRGYASNWLANSKNCDRPTDLMM